MVVSMLLAATGLLGALPTSEACTALSQDPAAALSYSTGLQGFVYGYPIVDMLKQKHNETHRTRPDQPVVAAVNTMVPYPHILTPDTQGELRAANADTLYVNGWLDLSQGPVLLDTPDMGARYYTLAFMDLFGKPHHIGTRTNQGKATRYALVMTSSDCPRISHGCWAGSWPMAKRMNNALLPLPKASRCRVRPLPPYPMRRCSILIPAWPISICSTMR